MQGVHCCDTCHVIFCGNSLTDFIFEYPSFVTECTVSVSLASWKRSAHTIKWFLLIYVYVSQHVKIMDHAGCSQRQKREGVFEVTNLMEKWRVWIVNLNYDKGWYTAILVCVITLQTQRGSWCTLLDSWVHVCECMHVSVQFVGLLLCIIPGVRFILYDTALLCLVF